MLFKILRKRVKSVELGAFKNITNSSGELSDNRYSNLSKTTFINSDEELLCVALRELMNLTMRQPQAKVRFMACFVIILIARLVQTGVI